MATAQENQRDGLVSKLSNAKLLLQIFRAIHFKDDATVFLGANGIKMTVEEAKSFQANAFVQREIFHEYKLKDDIELSFNITLPTLLECLNLFGGSSVGSVTGIANSNANSTLLGSHSSAVVLHHAGHGEPLSMWLEEDGVVSEASIPTREAQDTLDFDFCRTEIAAKLILVSEHMREIFAELDNSSEVVELSVSPHESVLRISTFGTAGQVTVQIPADSDVVGHFDAQELITARYRLSILKHGLKPIGMSEKVSLRMDKRDFLCLQYMVKFNEGTCFLEFYCAPEEDVNDAED